MVEGTARPVARKRQHESGDRKSGRAGSAERAYQQLLEAIVALQIPPGTLLNERELCGELGVTRPTLGRALHKLVSTSLVSVVPKRGILVSPIGILDGQQVFDARQAIECKLVELACQRSTAEQIAGLRELLAEFSALGHERDAPLDFLSLDHHIHLALANLGRNPFLEESFGRVWVVNSRLWNLFFRENGSAREYFLSHAPIVDAIENRDPEAARLATVEHLAASKELLQSGLWGR